MQHNGNPKYMPAGRPIPRQLLRKGMTMRGDLVDAGGNVLVEADTKLTDRILGSLDGVNLFTGGNWPMPEEQSAATVVRRIAEQRGESIDDDDRRQHPRKPWQMGIRLTLTERHGDGIQERCIEVDTVDISLQGFGFLFKQFVHPGTTLTAQFPSLPDKPTLSGIVRSCVNIGGFKHRVGVEFMKKDKPAKAA